MMYFTVHVFLLILSFYSSSSERLHEQIYSSIEGGAACFRRLNGTHQAGCSSSDKGAIGVVQMIKDVDDAKWVVYNSTAGPYMAVVNTAMFNNIIGLLLEKPDNVAGILLYENATDSAKQFSEESSCPNEYSSADGNQCNADEGGWNNLGTGLLRMDIPFPIFYLPESRATEIDKIEECYQKFNLDKQNHEGMPLCSVQLNSFMYAAVNSEVCLRRSAASAILTSAKVCDPLGDHNVYYSLFPRTQEAKPTKVTLVTARIDSSSLFDGVSPGAASSVVGMVSLLTAATTLSQLIPVTEAQLYNENILWTLLNGEAFDYIGSQRVAFDILHEAWPPAAPLRTSDIRLHLEIGQIGGALAGAGAGAGAGPDDDTATAWPFYAYVPYSNANTSGIPEITELLNIMANYNMSVLPEFTENNIPPSSLHSFRRILKNVTESGELPQLLIVDHKGKFTNKFYNSALDQYSKIGFVYRNITVSSNGTFISSDDLLANGTMKESDTQVKIARLSTSIARTLYQRVTGKQYIGNASASAHLVDEMLHCFLQSQACRLLLAADYAGGGGAAEQPAARAAPLYVGVAAWPATAPVFAGHLLALLTGTHLTLNKTGCDALDQPGFSHYWLRGWNHSGVCIQTTMNFSQAVSPAFLIKDYEYTSGEYSTWTESVWQAMSARVFVTAGGGGARAAAAGGLAAAAAAALLAYWLRRHAHTIFGDAAATSIVNDDAASGILRTVNC